jgi:hypothetical protein
MRVETLPSPGLLSNGIRIRIEAAKAISAVEINAGIPANGGKSSSASLLKAFFDTCSASIAGIVDNVVPTVAARTLSAAAPKRIVLTFTEGIDPKFVPAVGAFAITGQVKAVTKVTISGPYVYLDVATDFVAGAVSVAYTQPGAATNLRDIAGNLVASFTATAVTNTIA